jgi:hypothetical protein
VTLERAASSARGLEKKLGGSRGGKRGVARNNDVPHGHRVPVFEQPTDWLSPSGFIFNFLEERTGAAISGTPDDSRRARRIEHCQAVGTASERAAELKHFALTSRVELGHRR